MPPVYRGTLTPLEQRFTEDFSPVNGTVRSLEWKSFDRTAIQQYAAQYAALGCSYHIDVQHGIATLLATDNLGQFVIDVWEVGVSDQLVSSLKNPRNVAAIGDENLKVIARALRDGSTLADAVTSLVADGLIPANEFPSSFAFLGSSAAQAAAQRMYRRMLDGSDSFFYSQYTLRHTTNVSNRYSVNVSDVGVGCIYNQAQFISEATNASQWIFPLPGRLVFKLNAASTSMMPNPVPANYQWGWLKSASPESTAPYDRVNIVTEYKMFLWSTDEYQPF